jgi:uncharacterized protein (DUF58 family)
MPDTPLIPDPQILARIGALELHARQIVEGWLSGMHRSVQHGFAIEFAQHREYVPGDDIRHIDWKVFGRTERYHLKQYELETNLVCWLVVDASESMRYGSGAITKYDYAARVAAALAWMVIHQADALGLATWDERVRHFLRPSGNASHLREVLRILAEPPSGKASRLGVVLQELSERLTRRGIVLIFSDFFDDMEPLLAALRQFRHHRHEVAVFHVLDPAEIEFPFRDSTLFRGLENLPELLTDPLAIRESYLQEFNAFAEQLQQGCRDAQIDFLRLRTDADPGLTVAHWLNRRSR